MYSGVKHDSGKRRSPRGIRAVFARSPRSFAPLHTVAHRFTPLHTVLRGFTTFFTISQRFTCFTWFDTASYLVTPFNTASHRFTPFRILSGRFSIQTATDISTQTPCYWRHLHADSMQTPCRHLHAVFARSQVSARSPCKKGVLGRAGTGLGETRPWLPGLP